ncbi:hypothetical protein LuPra_03793 [Luteitalea pratensis]|uniref:DUF937 domain-containing protein n=1 Tax=Luteitalea pratensis TaxID=1855912 RepID=A0A143PPD0_LUTPR|nr:DUF937 domain-containing protein [Luteitalea pratensis]AMY10557.1 hypothetical protein LuPra_03793 [Luteitalea pratensis]
MNMLEQLLGANNGVAVDQISRQFGLDAAQAQSALSALLPTVAAGVQRNAAGGPGLDALLGSLAGAGVSRYAEDPSQLAEQAAVDHGNGILGQIFGSKDVSRQVALRAAAQSGVGPEILKAMLPMVATLVMGALAKGGSGGALAQAGQPQVGAGGGLLDMLTPVLDGNNDGSVMDDILGMANKFIK